MSDSYNRYHLSIRNKYRHFGSIEGLFYNLYHQYDICSINGFCPIFDNFDQDFRVTRFIRDPRDLVVSGYFYHKNYSEPWFRFKNLTLKYWSAINGYVPNYLPKDKSFADYLNTVSLEEGLRAEIEFRKYHFQSMLEWPDDERIKLLKYEDILSKQVHAFQIIVNHLQTKGLKKRLIINRIKKYAITKRKKDNHIRDPDSGQWRKHFSQRLNDCFVKEYGDILRKYDYSEY